MGTWMETHIRPDSDINLQGENLERISGLIHLNI